MNLSNMPQAKLGIVAVSRNCFPKSLSENRRKAVAAAIKVKSTKCPTVVENEMDMKQALKRTA